MASMAQRVAATSDEKQKKVVISPASSNKDLAFNHSRFKYDSQTYSLRDAFQEHPAYKAVFPSSGGFIRRVPRGTPSEQRSRGDIVALSKHSAHGDSAVDAKFHLSRASEGITSAIMTAYNNHCDLVLSPDDVWITILAQLCAYFNKHAESLRDKIVDHKGKKKLRVEDPHGSLRTADYEGMIRDLLRQIRQNIKSPELADWFRPGFTTTTTRDEVCAAATAMATMQAYFEYFISCGCGIPSVTLMGTVDDWRMLRSKIERLVEFEVEGNPEGKVMEQWTGYLRKVCDGFVESAEHPDSAATLEFWDKVLSSRVRGGSGMVGYTTGWVSVFSCFNEHGNFVAKRKSDDVRVPVFSYRNNRGSIREEKSDHGDFPMILGRELCHNVVSCPVAIHDDGKEYDGTLFTGQVVFEVGRGEGEERPTLRPRNDWCMAVAVKK